MEENIKPKVIIDSKGNTYTEEEFEEKFLNIEGEIFRDIESFQKYCKDNLYDLKKEEEKYQNNIGQRIIDFIGCGIYFGLALGLESLLNKVSDYFFNSTTDFELSNTLITYLLALALAAEIKENGLLVKNIYKMIEKKLQINSLTEILEKAVIENDEKLAQAEKKMIEKYQSGELKMEKATDVTGILEPDTFEDIFGELLDKSQNQIEGGHSK